MTVPPLSFLAPPRFTLLHWFIVYACLHLSARFVIALDTMDTIGAPHALLWLRSALSDAAMAFLPALLAIGLGRLSRFLPYALLVLWCVALAGNREYIGEWQSNLSALDMAGLFEPAFIRGSVLTPRLAMTACSLGLLAFAVLWMASRSATAAPSKEMAYAGLVIALVTLRLPATPPYLWMQENPLEENIHQLVRTMALKPSAASPSDIQTARRLLQASRRQDLQGGLIVAPRPRSNVLIVTIESLSEPTMQRWMPYLKRLADEHLHYTQYINPNITTIRGLYTQLSGEETYFGRFGRDRIAPRLAALNLTDQALPAILNGQGYQTLFMQAAELEFQDKEHVMKGVGFTQVIGDTAATPGDRFSEWGVDDKSLYANAQRAIETLEKEHPGQPWMVTLLTVGTHHPYGVDPSFQPGLPARERAFRYSDLALERLVRWLESTGRAENTLLMITGDESREGKRSAKGVTEAILHNQGFLVVMTPGRDRRQVGDAYAQSDLPVSVLDYLGVPPPAWLGGRSLFRQYDHFRPLVFADYSQAALYAVPRREELIRCDTGNWKCSRYTLPSGTIFETGQALSPQPFQAGVMQAVFEENRARWFRKL